MNDSFYFPHNYSARNDIKILKLRARRGALGYGIYWMLIETLHELSEPRLNLEDLDALAPSFGVAFEDLEKTVTEAISIGLFLTDGTVFYSQRVYDNLEIRKNISNKRAESGRLGGLKSAETRSKKVADLKQTEAKASKMEANASQDPEPTKPAKAKEPKLPASPLEAAFSSFLEMRKKLRKPATDRAIELLRKKLKTLAGDNEALAIQIIEQSELKGWSDFFELKQPYQAAGNGPTIAQPPAANRTASLLGNHAKYAQKLSNNGTASN